MNASPPMTDTERLAVLVSAKVQVLEILTRLSRRQLELVSRGETPALLKLLTAKETVLAQLQALERQLDPFRSEDPEARVWSSRESRSACQRDADRANALLTEALALERQAEAAMLGRRDAAASALSAVQVAADARTAYAVPQPAAGTLHVEG